MARIAIIGAGAFGTSQAVLASATKGIENETPYLMSQVQEEAPAAHRERLAYLSGPSFANDVGSGLPTNLTCAALHSEVAVRAREVPHSSRLRIYTSDQSRNRTLGNRVAGGETADREN